MNALISFLSTLLGSWQRATPGPHAPSVDASLLHETQSFAETLARIAETQVGVEEHGGNNRGPQVQAYQSATNLAGTGWPWCAAFVCWVVWQAIQKAGLSPAWPRPRTPGAYALETWARESADLSPFSAKVGTPPRRGDLCTFTWSHCGIVVGYDPERRVVYTVEGNAGPGESRDGRADGVRQKEHHISKIRKLVRFHS